MIPMKNSFILPADYDMGIIDRRIRDRGQGTDGLPHLGFKAYLSAIGLSDYEVDAVRNRLCQ